MLNAAVKELAYRNQNGLEVTLFWPYAFAQSHEQHGSGVPQAASAD